MQHKPMKDAIALKPIALPVVPASFASSALGCVLARVAQLDGRAGDVAIGTEYTAVTLQWAQQFPAAFAVVKELTGIGGHRFALVMAALGTGNGRLLDDFTHFAMVISVVATDTRPISPCPTIV